MSDIMLQIAENPQARRLVSSLGVPLPQKLRRGKGPVEERPLKGQQVIVGGAGALHGQLAEALAPAGAQVHLAGAIGEDQQRPYDAAGEAYARPVGRLSPEEPGPTSAGLIYDGTGIRDLQGLAGLHAFFQPRVRNLQRNGRIVVLCRPAGEQETAEGAAAAQAVDGFVRSVAKEVGRKGSTAQLIYVAGGAEDRLAGPLRFLLSTRSAYVSGQTLWLTATARAPESTPFARPLQGKVALVTGAARGIGAATAAVLAREGAHVVCLDRPADDEPLARVARKVGGTALPQDIAAPDAADSIASALQERHGRVDVVVHNAGVTRDKTLGKMDPERWDQVLDVNLAAVLRITARLLSGDVLAEHGRVICLSSISGVAGNFGQTNYAASKAGLIGYVRHLAGEVADKGITVNAVAPGFIETRMTAGMPLFTREVGRRLCNLSQGGLPADVGEAIAFLATPGASGVTGAVLRVCGGSLLGA